MQSSPETELEKDRYRLSAIIEGTNVGTWEWNVQSGETIFNDRWASMIGYSLDEISPISIATWKEFTHPADMERADALLKKHFSGETDYYECELRMKHKNGCWVWILDRGKVSSWTNDGKPLWVFGTHADITDRKHSEEKNQRMKARLKKSERNLKNFFNMNIDFLWVIDTEANIITINKTVKERLGYSLKDLKDRPVVEIHPPAQRNEAGKAAAEMLAGRRQSNTIPLMTKAGVHIPVETYTFPGTWNGKPAIFGISKDITALKLSETKFAEAFKTNPAITAMNDLKNGKFVEVNDTFYKTLGGNHDEVIGRKSAELFGYEDSNRKAWLSELKKHGYVNNREIVIYKKDGSPLYLLLSASIITIHDKKYSFTSALDITELKNTESRLKQSLFEKELLMKELNHRVKNNLSMLTSLIRLKTIKSGSGTDLSDIESQIDAIRIVHEILYTTEDFTTVKIRNYILKLMNTIFSTFSSRPVKIKSSIQNIALDTGTTIIMGLIVNEIATNAIKYGHPESGEAVFSIEIKKNNNRIHLVLSNNGAPFPEDKTLHNPGTLGLQLISNMVSQLNGTIDLQKRPHPVFTISFSE